jgi:hypothetical protein
MKYFLLVLLLLLPSAAPPHAVGLWLYPEAAEAGSLYSGVFSPALSFIDGFAMRPPDLFFDFMLPGGLPLSLGAFMEAPDPNLKHFGVRAACHIDVGDPKMDLFFLYVFDCGFVRDDLLLEYNDTPVERRYYDFRAGVRRLFGDVIALSVETDYKLSGLRFGLAVKIL